MGLLKRKRKLLKRTRNKCNITESGKLDWKSTRLP